MTAHNYQHDINSLLRKDDTGLLSSFALQLESILSTNEPLNETGMKVLDETMKLLHELSVEANQLASNFDEGYGDMKYEYTSY